MANGWGWLMTDRPKLPPSVGCVGAVIPTLSEMAEIREALLDLFLDAEQVAVTSYTTRTGGEWGFNDRIWRENGPKGFKTAGRARRLLSLKPYRCRG